MSALRAAHPDLAVIVDGGVCSPRRALELDEAGADLVLVSAGLLHTGPGRRYLAWTTFAVVMGFLLGALFELTGSLLGPVVAHVIVNYFNLLRIGRLQLDPDPVDAADAGDS